MHKEPSGCSLATENHHRILTISLADDCFMCCMPRLAKEGGGWPDPTRTTRSGPGVIRRQMIGACICSAQPLDVR